MMRGPSVLQIFILALYLVSVFASGLALATNLITLSQLAAFITISAIICAIFYTLTHTKYY